MVVIFLCEERRELRPQLDRRHTRAAVEERARGLTRARPDLNDLWVRPRFAPIEVRE